jgi:hypothetical protein
MKPSEAVIFERRNLDGTVQIQIVKKEVVENEK